MNGVSKVSPGVGTGLSKPVAAALSIVDCDFHPFVPLQEVIARMPARARRSVQVSSYAAVLGREHNRFLIPTGEPLRLDAVPTRGGLAGSDPAFAVADYLDRWGIAAAVMMPIQAMGVIAWAAEEVVNSYLAAMNDLFLEMWHAEDPRFKMLISVSPHDPDAAVREIERLADKPGVVGFQIPMGEIGLGSSAMFKVYAAAAHFGLPLVLHPNSVDCSLQNSPSCAGRVTRSYAEHHVLLSQPGQGAATQLVMSGALERFPTMRVVLAEFGFSWVGPMMWRMDTAWQRGGGADGLLPRPPSEYLLNQLRFTTQPYDEPGNPRDLVPILDSMQAHRTLVFSSDYPHWDTDRPDVVLRRLPVELRERVAKQTAMETFGTRLGL